MEKTIRSKINPGSEIMARTLNQKLTEAGYQMLGQQNETEELILSLLKTKDTRYLKAIPFLIYTHNPDLDKIIAKTKDTNIIIKEIIPITIVISKRVKPLLLKVRNLFFILLNG